MRDSNPHDLRHRNLNPTCLPIPPIPLFPLTLMQTDASYFRVCVTGVCFLFVTDVISIFTILAVVVQRAAQTIVIASGRSSSVTVKHHDALYSPSFNSQILTVLYLFDF